MLIKLENTLKLEEIKGNLAFAFRKIILTLIVKNNKSLLLLRTALITSSILKPFPCRRIVCDIPHPWSSTEWWPRHFLLRHSQTQLSLPRYKSAGTAEYQAEHVLLQNIKHYIMFNNKLFWPHALLNDELISPQSHQLSSSKFSVSNPRYTKI